MNSFTANLSIEQHQIEHSKLTHITLIILSLLSPSSHTHLLSGRQRRAGLGNTHVETVLGHLGDELLGVGDGELAGNLLLDGILEGGRHGCVVW